MHFPYFSTNVYLLSSPRMTSTGSVTEPPWSNEGFNILLKDTSIDSVFADTGE